MERGVARVPNRSRDAAGPQSRASRRLGRSPRTAVVSSMRGARAGASLMLAVSRVGEMVARSGDAGVNAVGVEGAGVRDRADVRGVRGMGADARSTNSRRSTVGTLVGTRVGRTRGSARCTHARIMAPSATCPPKTSASNETGGAPRSTTNRMGDRGVREWATRGEGRHGEGANGGGGTHHSIVWVPFSGMDARAAGADLLTILSAITQHGEQTHTVLTPSGRHPRRPARRTPSLHSGGRRRTRATLRAAVARAPSCRC